MYYLQVAQTPMIDMKGNHTLPQILEDVPFDQPVRVLFTLCYAPPEVAESERGLMFAELEELAPV